MCACEPDFTCSRCRGTWLADDYPELPEESERGADDAEKMERLEGFLAAWGVRAD